MGKLKNKADLNLLHETINNNIKKHRLNNSKAETVPKMNEALSKHTWRIRTIIYCQREGKRDSFDQLLLLDMLNRTARKKLVANKSSGGIKESSEDIIPQ